MELTLLKEMIMTTFYINYEECKLCNDENSYPKWRLFYINYEECKFS